MGVFLSGILNDLEVKLLLFDKRTEVHEVGKVDYVTSASNAINYYLSNAKKSLLFLFYA